MKEYRKKQFPNGTEYIEASPKGYPDWWNDFKEIVETSPTLEALMCNLMEFEPITAVPQDIHGQTVFNPFMIDFLINNPEYLETFYKGHKKGLKDFKKTYFKKYPDEREMGRIFDIYNNKFKETILEGFGAFANGVIEMAGFKNGILTAYWSFENDHLRKFESFSTDKNNPHPVFFEPGAFEIFKKWMEKSTDEPVKKISFIFQKLKDESKLRNTNHMEFSEWAFNNSFIDRETYNFLFEKGGFDSPTKALTKGRMKLYGSIISN